MWGPLMLHVKMATHAKIFFYCVFFSRVCHHLLRVSLIVLLGFKYIVGFFNCHTCVCHCVLCRVSPIRNCVIMYYNYHCIIYIFILSICS